MNTTILTWAQWREYASAAMRTRNVKLTAQETLVNAQLGLAGEAGELCDVVKKIVYHGRKDVSLTNEAGDVLWYLALLECVLPVPGWLTNFSHEDRITLPEEQGKLEARALYVTRLVLDAPRVPFSRVLANLNCLCMSEGKTIHDAMAANVAKLLKRFPDGFETGKGRDR